MSYRAGLLRLGALILACSALVGCSGGSDNAASLLKQTFCARHRAQSGVVNLALSITPSGSTTITRPISLTFGGPFQSLGAHRLPKSDFTITLNGLGRPASLGLVSTGSQGYVVFEGTAYSVPRAAFQKLESRFSHLSPATAGCHSAALHLHPLTWLNNPQVAGTQTINGAKTTHIRAGINVSALLNDLAGLLQSHSHGKASGMLSPGIINLIAADIQNPTFNAWTGTSDKMLRRAQVHLTIPIPGQISGSLGGLQSADVTLALNYSGLGQSQTIAAPSSAHPFRQFGAKFDAFAKGLERAAVAKFGGLIGMLSGSGGLMGGSSSAGGSGKYPKYSQCMQRAAGSPTKMHKCAALLGGG